MQIGSRTRDVDVEDIVGDVEDQRGETQSIQLRSGKSQQSNRERET